MTPKSKKGAFSCSAGAWEMVRGFLLAGEGVGLAPEVLVEEHLAVSPASGSGACWVPMWLDKPRLASAAVRPHPCRG